MKSRLELLFAASSHEDLHLLRLCFSRMALHARNDGEGQQEAVWNELSCLVVDEETQRCTAGTSPYDEVRDLESLYGSGGAETKT